MPTAPTVDDLLWARHTPPVTRNGLWRWLRAYLGVSVAYESVCEGHTAPFDLFARQYFERPAISLWHGPRGSGKSYMSAIDTHVTSRFNPGHKTAILGGSLAQSGQIYEALRSVSEGGLDQDVIESLYKTEATYANGSSVSLLAASPKSVHGPHVQTLKLDEVDEIDPDIREHAMGMPMAKGKQKASILMTSTWHHVGGPMAELIDRGRAGAFPVDTFCVFEVLERCPPERSGPDLEECPECPIVEWCHSDRHRHPSGLPKAKRSRGHYRIDDLITKAQSVSQSVFESDYLCLRPRAAGVWFTEFTEALHVTETAEYQRQLPVDVSIDPGVCCGAVFLQVQRTRDGMPYRVNVFGDYYQEDFGAGQNAVAIRDLNKALTGLEISSSDTMIDPASKERTAVGPTLKGEFEREHCVGRNGLRSWSYESQKSKVDGLGLISALLMAADKKARLFIHPRCKHLIRAFQTYRRAKINNQLCDWPADPQHPSEDLVDPLNGALKKAFPEGRSRPPNFTKVHASRVL